MDTYLLLRLIVGHILGDFVFQTNSIAEQKGQKISFLILHVFMVFAALMITTAHYWWENKFFILPLAIIAAIHFIDGFKAWLFNNIWGFLGDQIIHLLSLVLVPTFFGFAEINKIASWTSNVIKSADFWIYFCGYLTVTFVGKVFIGVLLNHWLPSNGDAKGKAVSGYIGMVERAIALTLMLNNQYTALGIVFVLKGVARKPFIEDKVCPQNGEYFFLGTGVSFLFAITIGLLLEKLLVILY